MNKAEKIIRETKQKMCLNKKAYETEGAAEFFSDTYMQRPYKCPYCGKWHLSAKEVASYRYKEDKK